MRRLPFVKGRRPTWAAAVRAARLAARPAPGAEASEDDAPGAEASEDDAPGAEASKDGAPKSQVTSPLSRERLCPPMQVGGIREA
jgi:hypothetical protein